jgi:6-phosphogluconolactonase (cycloisomerase 2 family)
MLGACLIDRSPHRDGDLLMTGVTGGAPPRRSLRLRQGLLASLTGIAVLAAACTGGSHPASSSSPAIAAGAAAPFVYVADTKSGKISQYSASPGTFGALQPLSPSAVPTGPFPYTVGVDPQGTSAYALSSADEVSQYTINPRTGKLTPKSPPTVAAGSGTAAIAFTPNGRSAYVVGNKIYQYSINPATGSLTPKSPAAVATPPNPEPIAVSPNGKYAYVANCGGCGYALRKNRDTSAGPAGADKGTVKPSFLLEYRINPKTGALSPKPVTTVLTGNGANWVAIAPNGRSAYVATSANGGSVWQYTINPVTGKLTPKNPETDIVGGSAHNIVVAPNGKNAYVIGVLSSKVSQYRINPHSGTLSSIPASSAATGLHPEAIAIAPNGESAYVTSENDGMISQYTVNPVTGKITPMSPATVAAPSGSLGLAATLEPLTPHGSLLTRPGQHA